MATSKLCAAPLADSDSQSENKVFKADPAPEFNTVTNTKVDSARSEESAEEQLKLVLTESHCHVCDAVLMHASQRNAHYQGKRHAMKLKTYLQTLRGQRTDGVSMRWLPGDRDRFCSLCNMVFSSAVVAKSHYDGKVHSKNLRKHSLPPNAVFAPTQTSAQLFTSSAPSAPLDSCKTSLPPAPSSAPSSLSSSVPLIPSTPFKGHVLSASSSASSSLPSSLSAPSYAPSQTIFTSDSSSAPAPAKAPSSAPLNTSASSVPSTTASCAPGSSSVPPLSSSAPSESDPERFCSLCCTSFTHRQMALQHYSGKKHQRNQSRREVLQKMEVDGGKADSLHCALCCLHFSSVEMYQAHMGGAKHVNKEQKVQDICRSQQKVYSSFNDELQDYIKVQQVRGLRPKPGLKDTNKDTNKEASKEPSDNLQDHSWAHPKPAPRETNEDPYEDAEEDAYFYPPPPLLYYPVRPAWGTPGWDYAPQAQRKRKYEKEMSSESMSESSVTSESEGEREKRRRGKERRKGYKERRQGHEERRHKKRRRERENRSKRLKNQEGGELEERGEEEGVEDSGVLQGALQQVRQDSGKQRTKREKKKQEEDTRTEEERLWDDSILGC